MYIFLKKSTKEYLTTMTKGLILNIDFLKNLKKFICFFKITPAENNLTKLKFKLKSEKKSCLKLVDILKMFWKKYSEPSWKYLEFLTSK